MAVLCPLLLGGSAAGGQEPENKEVIPFEYGTKAENFDRGRLGAQPRHPGRHAGRRV